MVKSLEFYFLNLKLCLSSLSVASLVHFMKVLHTEINVQVYGGLRLPGPPTASGGSFIMPVALFHKQK